MGTKNYILRTVLFCLGTVLANGCLELYNPPTSTIPYNFLVVDGFLNASDSSFVKLSLTQTLSSTDPPTYVADASVQIEDDQGNIYLMPNYEKGTYFLPPQSWNPSANYRIRIGANGNNYLSDFVPLTQTPPIDSVTWKVEPKGVQLFVNTHDPSNKAEYYLWTYVETWEYTPPYYSYFIIQDGQIQARTNDIYHCWKTQPSTQLFVTSALKLSEDIISEFPLNLIGPQDARLQYKYSTLVKQQALSKDAYQYWSTLQKNTENLGTLFGPQPTQLTGNIHNLGSSSQLVLGYFNATSVQQQRIFIRHDQVPNIIHYLGYDDCIFGMITPDDVPNYKGEDLIIDAVFMGTTLIGYTTGTPDCVDCRLHGGVNVKPAFWGN